MTDPGVRWAFSGFPKHLKGVIITSFWSILPSTCCFFFGTPVTHSINHPQTKGFDQLPLLKAENNLSFQLQLPKPENKFAFPPIALKRIDEVANVDTTIQLRKTTHFDWARLVMEKYLHLKFSMPNEHADLFSSWHMTGGNDECEDCEGPKPLIYTNERTMWINPFCKNCEYELWYAAYCHAIRKSMGRMSETLSPRYIQLKKLSFRQWSKRWRWWRRYRKRWRPELGWWNWGKQRFINWADGERCQRWARDASGKRGIGKRGMIQLHVRHYSNIHTFVILWYHTSLLYSTLWNAALRIDTFTK